MGPRVLAIIAVTLVTAGGCRPRPASAETSINAVAGSRPPEVAESRFFVEKTEWPTISVENHLGWDPPFVARRAVVELAACREAIGHRHGFSAEPEGSLELIYVIEASTFVSMVHSIPRSERVLRYGVEAFFQPRLHRLVFTRDADIRTRTYMMSVALLMLRPDVAPVWFVDAVAMWNAGLALNRLRGERFWERGRVWAHFIHAFGDPGRETLASICSWGSSKFPDEGVDLITDWTGSGTRWWRPLGQGTEVERRAAAWFLVYFLATYDVGPGGSMRFGGTPQYADMLEKLLREKEGVDRIFSSRAVVALDPGLGEVRSYLDFVRRKVNIGHVRSDGVALAWDEYVSRKGKKTGEPGDDILRFR